MTKNDLQNTGQITNSHTHDRKPIHKHKIGNPSTYIRQIIDPNSKTENPPTSIKQRTGYTYLRQKNLIDTEHRDIIRPIPIEIMFCLRYCTTQSTLHNKYYMTNVHHRNGPWPMSSIYRNIEDIALSH